MKFRIRNLLKEKDIVPNIIDTLPPKVLNTQSEQEFYEYLIENDYSILCYHITRLTKQEIQHIKKDGLSFGSKTLLRNKIRNLPSCCDWFKEELLNYIDNLTSIQAEHLLCASYGKLDLVKDIAEDNIFHSNWGGETIYRYYDQGDGFQDKRFKKIHDTLQNISIPCIIIVRVNADSFERSNTRLYDILKCKKQEYICGSVYIEDTLPEVVDIIDLNTYSGIDFT